MSKESSSTPVLYLRDLITIGVDSCSPETNICELAQYMVDKGMEAFVVLDENNHAVGYVSQFELIAAFSRGAYYNLAAEDVMADGLPQVPADIPAVAAVQIMMDQGLRVLFVTHHAGGIEYPAAVITYNHILKYLANGEGGRAKDVGIKAERKSPVEMFIERRDAARKRNSRTI
jgi:CBS domain-containing protein